jgi:hypothetical protein
LTGILVGMALLEPVLLAWHLAASASTPRSRTSEQESTSSE